MLRNVFNCVDCGVDTLAIGEYYMVKDEVWEQAWVDRRRQRGPRHWSLRRSRRKQRHGRREILCIACLEVRIGRTLTRDDFAAVVGTSDRCAARYRNLPEKS
jgi:hypothetical protein